MSTKQIDHLAQEEGIRKTAKDNIRTDKKGLGQEYCTAKENNGDIIKWTRIGAAMTKEGDRYAVPKKLSDKAYEMQSGSSWSYDLKKPTPKNRKDFNGCGNIITWM